MNRKRQLKSTGFIIGSASVFVCFFVLFFSVSQKNKTFAQMNKDYQSSETYQEESLLDRARFVTKRDGEATIVVLGSSVTFGKGATLEQPVWGELLEDELNQTEGIKETVINRGYSGYSTADLIAKDKIAAVIKDEPDILIFELCLINNNRYPQNDIGQTKADIQFIMNTFKEQLPNTLIVLQTANPTHYDQVVLEQGKVTYDQYNNEIINFVRANQWPLIDTYHLLLDEMEEQHLSAEVVLSDAVHPNGDGYYLWFEILRDRLAVPVKMLQ